MQDDEITTIGDPILVARNTGKAGRLFGKTEAEIILRLRFNDDDAMCPA